MDTSETVQMLREMQQTARHAKDFLGAAAVEALSAALAAKTFRSKLPEAEAQQLLLRHLSKASGRGCGEGPQRDVQAGSYGHTFSDSQVQRVILSLVRQGLMIRDEQHGVPMLWLTLPGAGSLVWLLPLAHAIGYSLLLRSKCIS
jgi:hypothetical protein